MYCECFAMGKDSLTQEECAMDVLVWIATICYNLSKNVQMR